MTKTLTHMFVAISTGIILALAFYVHVTNTLCKDIDSMSIEQQSKLKLDEYTCTLPWYKKL